MMTRVRTWMFDVRVPLLVGCLMTGCCLHGCAMRGNQELLEAQLRQQEMMIRRFERETSQLKSELAVTRREMDLLRSDQAARGELAFTEETSRALAKAEGLAFNSLLTAGQNHDDVPGDERFHAVFFPRDAHGEVVKLAGHIEVEAIDPFRPSSEKTIGRWEYSPDQARKLWHAGFLASGFQLSERWQKVPQGREVLLLARLKTVDGRTFEATHTIKIEPPPVALASPELLPKPDQASAIEPVSYDVPEESRRVPDPERWEFDAKPVPSKPRRPRGNLPKDVPFQDLPAEQPAEEKRKAGVAPPFPSGLQTSDNWTEETIPVVR